MRVNVLDVKAIFRLSILLLPVFLSGPFPLLYDISVWKFFFYFDGLFFFSRISDVVQHCSVLTF